MRCPNCHSEVSDEAIFCSECGQKIIKIEESNQQTVSSAGSRVQMRQNTKQNNNKIMIIIISVITMCIVAGAACYFVFFNNTDDQTETETTDKKTTSSKKKSSITLDEDELTVKVGEYDYIEPDMDCTYSVKDNTICEVDQFGTVKGLKVGETTVTCKAENGTTAECKITVEENNTISGDYVFPNSSTVLLTESDLTSKSEWELRIGINEIYARHHCTFKTEEIVNYFKGKSWYSADPNLTSDMMNANINYYLNDIEVKNVNFIRNYQETH